MIYKSVYCLVIKKVQEINKVLDLYADKILEFYKKIYKHDNDFYCVEKFFKHVYLFVFLVFNMKVFSNIKNVEGIIKENMYFLFLMGIVTLIMFIILFNDKKKLHKLTDEEWEHYKDGYCYHLTSRENLEGIKVFDEYVYLKPTQYWSANLQNWFRPSVYFFSSVPNEEQIKGQLLTNKKDVMIKIPISNLDRDRLRIRRKVYNVMVYTGPYVGKGEMIKFKDVESK